MDRVEIEQRFVEAGWELDGGFSGYLVVGEDHHLSILPPQWVWGIDDPVFELCDGENELTYWVREVPTPRRAAELLEEHGGPSEEERGNPHAHREGEEGEHHHREG